MMRWFLAWVAVIWSTAALSHEVRVAIGDLSNNGAQVRLAVALNAEALLAGVDLDVVTNTDDTPLSAQVDALRALGPDELSPRLQAFVPGWSQGLLRAGGQAVPLTLQEMVIDPPGNVDLPRDSQVVLVGTLPTGARDVAVHWPMGAGNLVLRQQGVENGFTGYLSGGQSSGPIPLAGGAAQGMIATFLSYIPVGFDHILPMGLDHILFVLGLFFLSTRLWPLIVQVSAFTLAHTVTLALAVLGYVSIPASIVEPLIALSIVYVAVENIRSDGLSRWRPAVVFGFGLLHGLGFASVLGEFGLPDGQLIAALIGFNIGVEIGQLAVIAAAFLIVWVALRVDEGFGDYTVAQTAYAIATLVFLGLTYLAGSNSVVSVLGTEGVMLAGGIAVLCSLCALAMYKIDDLNAYRVYVAVPASVGIALVGAYWFVERVFL